MYALRLSHTFLQPNSFSVCRQCLREIAAIGDIEFTDGAVAHLRGTKRTRDTDIDATFTPPSARPLANGTALAPSSRAMAGSQRVQQARASLSSFASAPPAGAFHPPQPHQHQQQPTWLGSTPASAPWGADFPLAAAGEFYSPPTSSSSGHECCGPRPDAAAFAPTPPDVHGACCPPPQTGFQPAQATDDTFGPMLDVPAYTAAHGVNGVNGLGGLAPDGGQWGQLAQQQQSQQSTAVGMDAPMLDSDLLAMLSSAPMSLECVWRSPSFEVDADHGFFSYSQVARLGHVHHQPHGRRQRAGHLGGCVAAIGTIRNESESHVPTCNLTGSQIVSSINELTIPSPQRMARIMGCAGMQGSTTTAKENWISTNAIREKETRGYVTVQVCLLSPLSNPCDVMNAVDSAEAVASVLPAPPYAAQAHRRRRTSTSVPAVAARALVRRELELELGDRLRRVEALGARPGAVEDGVAAVQAHLVLELLLALHLVGVARVRNPAVRGHERRWAEVLVLVPPVAWA